jgi:dipeptidyl aminopeptidase/acylaminoacyl peptidase
MKKLETDRGENQRAWGTLYVVTTGVNMKIFFYLLAAPLFVLIFASQSHAQGAPLIPISDMTKRIEFSNMALSGDGKKLAATVPSKGRENLVVIDLAKRTRSVITSFDTFDVVDFDWVNNNRLIFRVGFIRTALAETQYKGTYAVNADGSELVDLSRVGPRGITSAVAGGLTNIVPLSRIRGDTAGEFVVTMNLRRKDAADVYRLNTRTGRNEILTFDSPADTSHFVLDGELVPRIAFAANYKTQRQQVWYRRDAKAAWSLLVDWDWESVNPSVDRIQPIRFEADNRTLIVAANVGRDRFALYRYDPEEKKFLGLLLEDDLVDVSSGLIWSYKSKKLLGVRVNADRLRTTWFDTDMQNLQRRIDATLPGQNNVVSFSPEDESTALVRSYNARDLGRYYIYDRIRDSIEPLPEIAPWRKPEYQGERRYFEYKARDGLRIPAWLSLPPGVPAKNLPLVVNIHGGPNLRIYGESPDTDSYFLSNRGYAVLEPEPRASTGFGKRHIALGQKQWGQAMQDDITDGILALIKEGVVDRNRVCLYGGSYGGYATLQGMIREPSLVKCGLATVAVTDLELFQTMGESDTNQSRWDYGSFFRANVGDRAKDGPMLAANSPARNAEKIKGEVLLVMGAEDARVPIRHADLMVSVMKRAGVKHELVVYAGEGHGFLKDENRADLFRRMEQFFARHLGGRTSP